MNVSFDFQGDVVRFAESVLRLSQVNSLSFYNTLQPSYTISSGSPVPFV